LAAWNGNDKERATRAADALAKRADIRAGENAAPVVKEFKGGSEPMVLVGWCMLIPS
jgi:hypothetical protein